MNEHTRTLSHFLLWCCASCPPLSPPHANSFPEQLTLSAALAAQAKKNSSIYKSALYKSAGGALSSLLNTFVDESYYSGGSSSGNGNQHASSATCSSPNSMNAGTAGVPPRCAVAELGIVLAGGRTGAEDPFPSLRAVGLGRTGMTDRDAARLARSLRARSVDSPLEEVEVRTWRFVGRR